MKKEHKRLLLSVAIGALYIWTQPKQVDLTGTEMLRFLQSISNDKHYRKKEWVWKMTVRQGYTKGELWYQNECYYRIIYLEKSHTLHDEPLYREKVSSQYWSDIDIEINQLFIRALLQQSSEDRHIRLLREQLKQVKKRAWLK